MNSRIALAAVLATLFAACRPSRQPALLAGANGACVTTKAAEGSSPAASARLENPVATFDSVWTIISRSHWDTTFNGINWKAVRDSLRPKASTARDNAELRLVLGAMLQTLGQSHFSVLPANADDGVAGGARDLSGGTGLTVRDADPELLVTAVRAGSAAERAGVRPGFAVVAVDGCRLPERRHFQKAALDERLGKLERWREASGRLRGPVGHSVTITARDGTGKLALYRMIREADPGDYTKVGNLPTLSVFLEREQRTVGGRTVGIIRFNVWMPKLSAAIAAAVDSLRGSDAIVLDLRGNLGGMGMMSSGVAGHFVDTALTLGTMILRGGVQKYVINPQRVNGANQRVKPFSGPLALVVDELSVSTTEIFAAGLQALGRARVFGAQTAGQALPSVAETLPNGDVLYHAIANFLSPTGQPVEGAGVTPDVSAPATRAQLLKGRDPALEAAIQWAASGSVGRP